MTDLPPGGADHQRRRRDGKSIRARPTRKSRSCLASGRVKRDLLIEHLHLIQDRIRAHLSAAHLAALAQEIKLALAEVYEVANLLCAFRRGEGRGPPPPPVDGAGVREFVLRHGPALRRCWQTFPTSSGPALARAARALHGRLRPHAPGRCAVGHVQVMEATPDKVAARVAAGNACACASGRQGFCRLPRRPGTGRLQNCWKPALDGTRNPRRHHQRR